MQYVPTIDINQLEASDFHRKVIISQIKDALENIGFMCIVGHSVPEQLIERIQLMAKEFFQLPETVKTSMAKQFFNKQNPNMYKGYFPVQDGPEMSSLKEGFDIGMGSNPDLSTLKGKLGMFWECNVWPEESSLPGFQDCLQEYMTELQKLGKTLLRAIAESLNLDQNYFEPFFQKSLSTLRLLRYPENPKFKSGALSCSEHTDSGALTLLLQDAIGGLQVQDRMGLWQDVAPIRNSFVINTGDLFERWTGGRFKATRHRVLATVKTRYSIPFFFEPGGETIISCIPGGGLLTTTSNEKVVYAEYLYEKIKEFDEYKQEI